jgi:hypothetical protein
MKPPPNKVFVVWDIEKVKWRRRATATQEELARNLVYLMELRDLETWEEKK